MFISYHGEALDKKTPLLRSMRALNDAALKTLRLFGNTTAIRVVPTVGPEQEYFLIDRAFAALRPDLLSCARSVLGARPPKGQQLEDHYFGSIQELAFRLSWLEFEYELYKLGVPVKTRHNEVAPSRSSRRAPIFEEANIADRSQPDHDGSFAARSLRRHNFSMLLHEKPFAGINGSGKHNNWSMSIAASGPEFDGDNLLEPGKTPHENLRNSLVFLCATLRAVHLRAGVLRAAIASSGNDHRLGANEAPPAIISVYLGDQLNRILDAIEQNVDDVRDSEERLIRLGLSNLPDVQQDYTDRNRTSPFAFTGNKFEFRAVGSSASVALPMMVLNAAVSEALEDVRARIQQQMEMGQALEAAVMGVVRGLITETKAVRFEGNNYSEEWVAEAERRGLPNLRRTPEALAQFVTPEAIGMMTMTGSLTEQEVRARYHVYIERYLKDIDIEVETLLDLARTHVLPAAMQHQMLLAKSLDSVVRAKGNGPGPQYAYLDACIEEINRLKERTESLESLWRSLSTTEERERATHYAYDVVPAMHAVRACCDRLETMVADTLWPLPKYPEMLFLS